MTFTCTTCHALVTDTDPTTDAFELEVARHQDGNCFGVEASA